MKSEEIIEAWNRLNEQARERYRKEGCTLYASLDVPLALAAWVRRATLEEAARVVCPAYCAAGEKVYQILGTNRWWHVSFSRERSEIPCNASPIHDLIAAMDKEASHE